MADASLRKLVERARLVLFDFDGPVCDVFAGLPAPTVARQLEVWLPEKVDTDDPLAILQEAAKYGGGTIEAVEHDLIRAEVNAADTAVATPGGLESMSAALASGRASGILSNNSRQAIVRYLKNSEFFANINPIVGRKYARPDLMKPNPYCLQDILARAQLDARETLFIGDSVSDIEVARTVGVPVVGFSNKPEKAKALASTGASALVYDMHEICEAIRDSSDR